MSIFASWLLLLCTNGWNSFKFSSPESTTLSFLSGGHWGDGAGGGGFCRSHQLPHWSPVGVRASGGALPQLGLQSTQPFGSLAAWPSLLGALPWLSQHRHCVSCPVPPCAHTPAPRQWLTPAPCPSSFPFWHCGCPKPPTNSGIPSAAGHIWSLAGAYLPARELLPALPVTVDQLCLGKSNKFLFHPVDFNYLLQPGMNASLEMVGGSPSKFSLPWVLSQTCGTL